MTAKKEERIRETKLSTTFSIKLKKVSAGYTEQKKDRHPSQDMITGFEDELDLKNPDIEEAHERFKEKLYKYTVDYQDDREEVDRTVLQQQLSRRLLRRSAHGQTRQKSKTEGRQHT